MSHRFLPMALLVASLASALASPLLAQQHECAMNLTPQEAAEAWRQELRGSYRMPAQPLAGDVAPELAHWVVPLTFHIVRRSDGTGAMPTGQVAQAVIDANDAFVGTGIEFCRTGPVLYIDSDEFYTDIDTTAEINVLRSTNPVPGAINIYCTDSLAYEGGSLCGYSSFTFSSVQGIVMRNSCTGVPTDRAVFPHEIGHYFDLFHTHEPAFGLECVDGSNCGQRGDLLCDTPADPRLGTATVTTQCDYTGLDVDPCNSAPYAPLTNNFMSYSRRSCMDTFTQQQKSKAIATLVNLRLELDLTLCDGDVFESCSPAVPNSVGSTGQLSMLGSITASENDFVLRTRGLPQNVLGLYLNSQTLAAPFMPAGSAGNLCLGGQIGRYSAPSQVGFSGIAAEINLQLDLSATPTPLGFVMVTAGEEWTFQLWYRDATPAGDATSNFSNAITITFL